MNKRQFLSSITGLFFGSVVNGSDAHTPDSTSAISQTMLTIVGSIGRTNRQKLNPVTDQLMHKHGIQFERAYAFSLGDLLKLPAKTINPTMEYDEHVHQLSGPRLMDVLALAGARLSEKTQIVFHGIDGYSPEISLTLAKKYDYILATHLDGKVLAIGGFGPLFALYDADRIGELAAKPLNQRFALCPWGLYCIEVVNS